MPSFCFILVASTLQLSGHRFKLEAEDFIFHILQKNFPNFGMKILALCSAKSLRRFFIPYFVLKWYILVENLVTKTDIYFSFSIPSWHIIVQTNRNKKLLLKDKHSYK